jgi:hypothetical protein
MTTGTDTEFAANARVGKRHREVVLAGVRSAPEPWRRRQYPGSIARPWGDPGGIVPTPSTDPTGPGG